MSSENVDPGTLGMNKPVGQMSIGDYLISRLHHYGVEHCFGIPGDYVITLYEQMHQSGLILPVNTCDEQGSGFAADAYARLRGLGLCCQTYGVGGLKSLHTTAEAFTERSPVVVVSGAPGLNERSKGKLLHHLIDGYYTQLKMFEEVTVASIILEDASAAFGEIDRVLSAALLHKQPVYIEVPRDMFMATGDPLHVPSDFRRPGSNRAALWDALKEIVQLINEAEKPVIWAGVELQRHGLQEALSLLLEASGIPYVSSILGKALLSELHPQFMGVYQGGLSPPDLREYVESSDCLIALGVLLTDINLGLHTAQIDPQDFIHVTAAGVNIKGHKVEQVQLQDLVERLAASDISHREAGHFPRPLMRPSESSGEIYLQAGSGDVFSIEEGESVAGRMPGNPILIDDPGVSRQHASFRREENQVWITDLNSSNGTFVNDNLLKPNIPQPLARRDEIGLGRLSTVTLMGPVEIQKTAFDHLVDLEATMVDPLMGSADATMVLHTTPSSDTPQFYARPGQKISSGRMFEAVDAFLDDKTVVAVDNGETLIAGVDLLIQCENGYFSPGFFTSVGFSVPIAMGAQLANPDRRPLVLTGDAAFQMTGVELSTMVRYGLNPIVIVMNNGGYGSERPIHDAQYVDILRWNYAAFTEVLGAGKGLIVKTEDEMEAALLAARAYTEGFVIIDVHLEKFDYSPSFERFLGYFAQGVE